MPFPPFVPRIDAQASMRTLDRSVNTTAAKVMVNGDSVFTILGGPIYILQLLSVCTTANDTTASTLQWSADGTDGAATTFTGASATLASAAAGAIVAANMTALTTAPDILTTGVGLGGVTTRGIIVPAGIITQVIGVGSTTGKWLHYMWYKPMGLGATVQANF
ncbi:hypothetical protein IVB03_39515 [Bradyrhizobium sp. 168]|uniref:hypothetical protein n=1 Tax=Bradyrhizobium sp. 168 TaxID=2782639 RepID=UPI001FFB4DC9|nr:hypothetical protein [Bradyrhizobium sp. 168]MCK1585485.1 hypothetical protein [Bradyrhizobium sp. 168]